MAVFNRLLPKLSKPRGISRRRQGGFVRLSRNLARWGSKKKFTYRDLFRASEPGVHYETYNPDSLLQRRNQLTYSEFPQGTANLSAPTSLVTTSALAGYDGAIAIGWDGATNQTAYKALADARYAGSYGILSVVVKMDDAGAPAFGSATPTSASNDFALVHGGGAVAPNSYTVVALGGGFYRVTAVLNPIAAANGSWGIIKYNVNSNRTFKTTAWHFEPNVTAFASYQKVTDWNTEYLAAAVGSIGMWQDNLGTTPVTAVEQTVGTWLDTKKGVALGPELWTNMAASGAAALTANGTVAVAGEEVTCTATASGTFGVKFANLLVPTASKTYRVQATITANGSSRNIAVDYGSGGTAFTATIAPSTAPIGPKLAQLFPTSTATNPLQFYVGSGPVAGDVFKLTVQSVREVIGNHATQATAGSRPKLSARYNLLTKTEQLDDAAWTKTGTSVVSNAVAGPTGALIADKVVMSAGSSTHTVMQNGPFSNGGLTPHVFRFMLKDAGQRFAQIGFANTGWASSYANFDLVNGVVGSFGGAAATGSAIRALGDGWYECSVTTTAPTAAGNPLVFLSGCATAADGYNPTFVGDGVSGFYSAGGDLRTTSDASLAQPAYQRVNTATDYDTAGFIHYLKFDGIDDSMQAPVDFSGVNKVTVWAGVTKLSDAATAVLAETSAQASANDGTFLIAAPGGPGVATVDFYLRGTVSAQNRSASGLASPFTGVLTCAYDTAAGTAAGQIAPRVNGATPALTAGGLTGAGNFGNQPLNIGRRNNTSLPFNGRMTSLTVRGSTTPSSVAFVKSMEQYAAKLAGQSFVST